MPIHEYVCNKCGKIFNMSGTFEMFISLIPQCPDCRSKNVRKKLFASNLIYKGKGFYTTDSKDDK